MSDEPQKIFLKNKRGNMPKINAVPFMETFDPKTGVHTGYEMMSQTNPGMDYPNASAGKEFGSYGRKGVWEAPTEFKATLELIEIYDKSKFIFRDTQKNRVYEIFFTDFIKMIDNTDILKGGIVSGKFGFVKRGASFGIEWLSE